MPATIDDRGDATGKPLGIIAALSAEARLLPAEADGYLLIVSGPGPRAAARAARQLLERGVTGILVMGVCGGLDPRLPAGRLLLPDILLDADGRNFPVHKGWRAAALLTLEAAGLAPDAGELLTLPGPLLTASRKAGERLRTGALGVDMEAAAVAAAAAQAGAPLLVLKAVSDAARQNLPPETPDMLDAHGRPRLRAILGMVARRPRLALDILGMARGFYAARGSLAAALAALAARKGWGLADGEG